MRSYTLLPSGITTALLLLSLAACENPSPVGLELIDEQGGDPVVTSLTPDVLAFTALPEVTGNTPRTLAGRVDDPLLGTFTAASYIDISLPLVSVGDEYRDGTVQRATLYLQPNYRYGDTTATVTLSIRELVDEWNEAGTPADTTVSTGALLTETTFAVTDTLVQISLPAAWVTANDAKLRDLTTLVDEIHGFQFESAPASGNAVVGFNMGASFFSAVTAADSVAFPIGKTLTTLRREGMPVVPEGRLLLQDGQGQNLEFEFDFVAKGLADAPLNRAVLSFTLDYATLEDDLPPHFVRPRPEAVSLFGLTDDLARLTIEDVVPDSTGRLVYDSGTFRNVIQGILLGTVNIQTLELGIPVNANSISPLLLYDLAGEDTTPLMVLTTVPTQ